MRIIERRSFIKSAAGLTSLHLPRRVFLALGTHVAQTYGGLRPPSRPVAGGLAEEARTIVTRVLRTADMAVTETRCDDPIPGLSQPIHREDAYLVALTLRDFPNRKYWQDGRQMPVCNLRIGQVDLHDLKRDPIALLDQPYHDLFFYIPRNASSGVWPIAELFFTRVSAQLGSTASHLAPPASHRGG